MKRSIEVELFLDDSDEHIHRNSDPDLGFYGIFRCAVKLLDSKMLFDPFEEQLDLPTTLVERRDGECWKRHIVCEKYQCFSSLDIFETNTT